MKISQKLFLTFIGYTAVVLIVALLLARWSFQQGFFEFTKGLEEQRLQRLADDLIFRYRQNDESWQFIRANSLGESLSDSHHPGPPRGPIGGQNRRPPPRGVPEHRNRDSQIGPLITLYSNEGDWLSGVKDKRRVDAMLVHPILLNGKPIGELVSWPPAKESDDLSSRFLQQQLNTNLLIGSICLLIAGLIAWALTLFLLRPIRELQTSISTLANGQYKLPEFNGRNDELGNLMKNVEHLADTLHKTREAKNEWFASISHELRTPLTVLMGEIEVLQAGIRPFDKSTLSSLEQEIKMLERLVGDLYQLSLSDIGGLKYTFELINFSEVVQGACDSLSTKYESKGLLLIRPKCGDIMCMGDPTRLLQLVVNILNNSLLYTDAPGQTRLTLEQQRDTICLQIEDSAPGVQLSDCSALFEPLFRLDTARTRKGSGAGLGLAICRNIVKAHRGKITASPSEQGGLKIVVTIPQEGINYE
ncbi:HAMP domain-containing protein [Alteromonas sp. 5E99-2]|uniref:ATP-binding protein n=1 Tax=Alteromonas sp. 5E99-2 TaxID=2817683 RepID=UPI001A985E05|nr:ATP-binding protein [Alteromonas sp. 5E99-2]MBO1254543.1 HAMP domain-containing protein [Alteromonas sp. 5E99-2]